MTRVREEAGCTDARHAAVEPAWFRGCIGDGGLLSHKSESYRQDPTRVRPGCASQRVIRIVGALLVEINEEMIADEQRYIAETYARVFIASRSAQATVLRCVCALGTSGITEAWQTRRPS